MPIKSFRGLMKHDTEDTIVLHTNTGSVGYRIKKFEVIPEKPGVDLVKSIFKIYSVPQTSSNGTIDFSDNTLLAAAYMGHNNGGSAANSEQIIITFDNMTFNQDICITYFEDAGNKSANYYIELEQVKLGLDENTVATLKDIKNIEVSNLTFE